jgi:hypothetical protein
MKERERIRALTCGFLNEFTDLMRECALRPDVAAMSGPMALNYFADVMDESIVRFWGIATTEGQC